MRPCKITVLKTLYYHDLAEAYRRPLEEQPNDHAKPLGTCWRWGLNLAMRSSS